MSSTEADSVFNLSDDLLSARMEYYLHHYSEPPCEEGPFCDLPEDFLGANEAVPWTPPIYSGSELGVADMGDPLCMEPCSLGADYCASASSGMTVHDSQEFLPSFFGFVKILKTRETAEHFWRSIEDEATVVLPSWPSQVPADGFFYGNVDLGAVDFGGVKSGTPYEADETFGLLVNYSGDSQGRLSSMYPAEKSLKLWKIRLYSTVIPEDCDSDDWSLHGIRASGSLPSSVYLYTKMALYVFGGDVFFVDASGCLRMDTPPDTLSNKSFVHLGPSARSSCRNAKRRRATDGPKPKKIMKKRITDVFDP